MMKSRLSRRWGTRTLGQELRERFGCRVHKIPLYAGLTCPNRDGTLGTGGCSYCGPLGSAAAWPGSAEDIATQLRSGIVHARRRFQAKKFIAYFQAFTNTYAPDSELEHLWDTALSVEDVVGLSVGTRPDCLADKVLDLIQSYQERVPYVCLEIGLQSAHDRTLERIHRGHDFACFEDAVARAHRRDVPICVHLILGLPGESRSDMMETIRMVLDMGIQGIKLHHLHVVKGSLLEPEYRRGQIRLLTMEEYVSVVCEALALISDRMVVHRFMGEAPRDVLVAPAWTRRKSRVFSAIDREFESESV